MAKIEIEEPQPAHRVIAHSFLRLATGVVLLMHVWGRLQQQPLIQQHLASLGVPGPKFVTWLVLGAELFAGVALILGLLTRFAAFGVLFGLIGWLVLTLQHGVTPSALQLNAERLELRLLLLASSLFFAALGAGVFSLDSVLRRRARLRAIARDPIWESPPYHAPPARPTR